MARPRRSSRLRRSPDDEERRKQNILGGAIIVSALAIAGTLVYFYQTATWNAYDEETGCPVDGATSITAVVVDGSDPIAPRQQAFLRNHLEAIKQDIPRGGALEVYRLGTDPERLLEPVVSVCNPGRGTDVNPWTGSQKRAEKLWRNTFQSRLQDVFDRLLNTGEEDQSPIFESIQSVGITRFASPQWQEKPAGSAG